MSKYFCYIILGCFSANVCAQSLSSSKVNEIPRVSVNDWGLDSYLWSHRHTENGNKPILDFTAIDNWQSIIENGDDISLSPNGGYFAYGFGKGRLDTMVIQSTNSLKKQSFGKVFPGFFSADSKQYIFMDKERRLCFLQLDSAKCNYIKNVLSYKRQSIKDNLWIAYKLDDIGSSLILKNLKTGSEQHFDDVNNYIFDDSGQWLIVQKNPVGVTGKNLTIYNLAREKMFNFLFLSDYLISSNGKYLLLKSLERFNNETRLELRVVNLFNDSTYAIWSSTDTTKNISRFNFDKTGEQVVFKVDQSKTMDEFGQRLRIENSSIWLWRVGNVKAIEMALDLNDYDKRIILDRQIYFTEDGQGILLHFKKFPEARKAAPTSVNVDVWNYQDTILQSTQLSLINEPLDYQAIINTNTGKIIWTDKENERLRQCINDYAIVSNMQSETIGLPIQVGDRYWQKGKVSDSLWLVSLKNGERRLITAKCKIFSENVKASPDGQYLLIFDKATGHYFRYGISTGKSIDISGNIPKGFLGIRSDLVFWLPGNESILVYDNYDIWRLDILGKQKPVNITNGYGRKNKILLSLFDEDFKWVNKFGSFLFMGKDTLIIKAFNTESKLNGYYCKYLKTSGDPKLLYMGPYVFHKVRGTYGLEGGMSPIKAANSNIWIVRRESITESPNYFVTNDFRSFRAITNLKSHEKHNWMTAELLRFNRLDGSAAMGVLYKPTNFDPNKKYPVIISFYITLSDGLYNYIPAKFIQVPNLKWGLAWMLNHGYLVFMPDINFKKGKWGPSTINTLDGAANYLKKLRYVDGKHLGACGHSNSGRFGYYLLTHSKAFAAMCFGEGHGGTNILDYAFRLWPPDGSKSNLEWVENSDESASLGLLWRNKKSWLDHTAVLQADKVSSPFLMMFNNKDYYDKGYLLNYGIQLFIALRRLEKPAWWLQYDNGSHGLDGLDAKDFTMRFTQFFDHFLRGAPAPSWMTKGIPSKFKGIEARYELDPAGRCGPSCAICKTWNNKIKKRQFSIQKEINVGE